MDWLLSIMGGTIVWCILSIRDQARKIKILEGCESKHNERLRKIERHIWPNPDLNPMRD